VPSLVPLIFLLGAGIFVFREFFYLLFVRLEDVNATLFVLGVRLEIRIRTLDLKGLSHVPRQVVHPVVVIDLFAKRREVAIPGDKVGDVRDRTYVLRVATSRGERLQFGISVERKTGSL